MHSEGYGTWSVCGVCVCVCVYYHIIGGIIQLYVRTKVRVTSVRYTLNTFKSVDLKKKPSVQMLRHHLLTTKATGAVIEIQGSFL